MTAKIDAFSGEYGFLSNFYPCRVRLDGIEYSSVEHAFQAAKSLIEKERAKIRIAPTPGRAKQLGKQVKLREDWETVKIGIMEELLKQKFINSPMKEWLLETQDADLVEGNYWGDKFWGVCAGEGQNNLGKLLMKIRTEYSGL